MRLYEITPLENLRQGRLYHLQPRITTCTSAMSHGSLKEMEENPQQQRKGKAKGRGMLSRRFSGFSGGNKNNTHISLRQVFEQKILWLFALLLVFSWPHLLLELKFPQKKNTASGGQRSRRVNFRSVVVDECAQATEPEVVLCVMRLLDWIFWKWPRYFWWKKSCRPVEVGSLSHYVRGLNIPGRISSINSNRVDQPIKKSPPWTDRNIAPEIGGSWKTIVSFWDAIFSGAM